MGKLKLDSHETYIEKLEERAQVNHHNSDIIKSPKSVISKHKEIIVAHHYGSAAQEIMHEKYKLLRRYHSQQKLTKLTVHGNNCK